MWRFPAAALLLLVAPAAAQFCPVDRCVRGGGPRRPDCLVQWSGIPNEISVCADGATCDQDGVVNGSCRFALAPCLDVFSTCPTPPPPVQQLVVQPRDHPAAGAIASAVTALAADRPGVSRCGSQIPVDVPVGADGAAPGTLVLRTLATGVGQRDRDRLEFRCLPAGMRPSFAADVAPILTARCTPGCHEPGGMISGIALTAEAGFGRLVPSYARPGRPRASLLMSILRYRMPPGCFRRQLPPRYSPGGCPTRDEMKTIAEWIGLGAPND